MSDIEAVAVMATPVDVPAMCDACRSERAELVIEGVAGTVAKVGRTCATRMRALLAGPVDRADLEHRIAVVLAAGGPVEDEMGAAEQVVDELVRGGDLAC